ncbi:MAG: peptidylprolyl isomerase [Magnetococcales bacterium]|nr:peptidylprolyl isomerase [Magnetococcales bacterium]
MFTCHRHDARFYAALIPSLLSGCLTPPVEEPPIPPPASMNHTQETSREPAADVIARMGEVQLNIDELQHYLDRLPPKVKNRLLADPEALEWRIRREILKKLLVHQAQLDISLARSNILRYQKPTEDETWRSTNLPAVSTPQPDYPEPTMVAHNQEPMERANTTRQIHLRQIFIPFNDDRSAARVKSLSLLTMAKRNQTDFATLARKLSMDQATASLGGDMGLVAMTALPPAFQSALKDTHEGDIVGPIEGDMGYHILQKMAEAPSSQHQLDHVAGKLRRDLRLLSTRDNLQNNLNHRTEENTSVTHSEGVAAESEQRYANFVNPN